ncbi:MAG: hypothetical protein R2800_15605 [Flavipsychrobacter sp.]
MPVKISPITGGNSSEVITLNEYEQGRLHFDMHYFKSADALPFEGKDFNVLWDDLSNAVSQFTTMYAVPASDVALRFVHCFDIGTNELYLRLQICTMDPPIMKLDHQFYPLNTTNEAWYEIRQGVFAPTPDKTLLGTEYFDRFYYKAPNSEVLERLADGGLEKYVRNLVLPWEIEIERMYLDNGSPVGAFINFGACSYTEVIPGTEAVLWPHGLVLYLSDSTGGKMLNNEDYISIFHYKGADFATQCPPICHGYLKPLS